MSFVCVRAVFKAEIANLIEKLKNTTLSSAPLAHSKIERMLNQTIFEQKLHLQTTE